MANENIERIALVQGSFFPYVVAHFRNPDVYAIGTMDLNDPSAREGGESDAIFYFMITPEEFGWYESAPEKLEDLAQLLQIRMPKSRFLATAAKTITDPKELNKLTDHVLGDDRLDNDEVFETWIKGLREQAAARAAAAKAQLEQQKRVPKTPYNEARHALALFQKNIKTIDAQIRDLQLTLPQAEKEYGKDSQEYKQIQDQITAILAKRREMIESKNGELEDALGNRIFTAPSIFVAMDSCWRSDMPWINPANGTACLFSTKEIADRFVKQLTEKNRFYPSIREVPRDEIKALLRKLEMLGVRVLLVDDTEEPVNIPLNNIIPALNRGFIENHNSYIRGICVRNMECSAALRLHSEAMEEEWMLTQRDHAATLDRSLLQELGKTALFVPVRLDPKTTKKMEGNYLYTEQANTRIHELCAAEKILQPVMNRPGFKGNHVVLRGVLNLTSISVNTPDGKTWGVAFTSREEAMEFIQNTKELSTCTIIAVSMDELKTVVANIDGALLDPGTLRLPVTTNVIDRSLEIRGEKRIQYNHHAKPAPAENTPAE